MMWKAPGEHLTRNLARVEARACHFDGIATRRRGQAPAIEPEKEAATVPRREEQTTTADAGVAEQVSSTARDKLVSGKVVGFAVALLLVLGLAVGAWLLWGQDPAPTAGGDQSTEQHEPPVAELTSGPLSDDPLPLAQIDGAAESHPALQHFTEVEELGYLDDREVDAYTSAGAADARFQGQRVPDGCAARILLTSASSVDAATTAAQALAELHIRAGAVRSAGPLKSGQITVLEDADSGSGQIQAHYPAGNVIVRIDVTHPEGLSAARPCFDTVLESQLAVLPANA